MNYFFLFSIDVLIHVSTETSKSASTLNLMPPAKNEKGVMVVAPIHPSLIQQISSVRIFIPEDLKPSDNRKAVLKSIEQVKTEESKIGQDQIFIVFKQSYR